MKPVKLTILHSNDMHGDFLAEMRAGDTKMIGGLSLLSGYIKQVRHTEENVLYAVAGDMVQGSMIDTEYRGVSTIELMNYLAPDVATLGNHEFDYGLPHLLFLEKLANFPIVNANLYIKKHFKRLMQPYTIINKSGLDVMFIGAITENVIHALSSDEQIGSFITMREIRDEVGRITNAYRNDDIDLTVILSHIGYESDLELAEMLDPEWGVDMIIGGHSHTVLDKPTRVNNILIAQAGVGTDQIGRFDLVVDDDTNSIVDYTWRLIPIDNTIAEPDHELEKFIQSFQEVVDRKYATIITMLGDELGHPSRIVETPLGNLVADALADTTGVDVVLIGSGSIRVKALGPLVTLGSFVTAFPYNDSLHRFTILGSQLKHLFNSWMRKENRNGEGECYQVNSRVRAVFDEAANKLRSLTINGRDVMDEASYTICLPSYHVNLVEKIFDLTLDEMTREAPSKVLSTRFQDPLEEYLRAHQNSTRKVEGRLVYV